MLTYKEFQKAFKWGVLAAFIFLPTTKANNPCLESKRIDFYLIRWFTKTVENLHLTAVEEGQLIDKYGYESTSLFTSKRRLIPTLAAVGGLYYLSHNARRYHITIIKMATSLSTVAPGLAILQIKYLATIHAVNYTNCAFYSHYHPVPPLRYCKEMALALLDFSLMGTDVLCDKLAELFVPKNIKSIFKKFSTALESFDWTNRPFLKNLEDTSENSSNAADLLRKHVRNHSDRCCGDGNDILFEPMYALNEFIKEKKLHENLPPIKSVTQGPLHKVMELWLKVEAIYKNSLATSEGKLDLVKALLNSEIMIMKHYKLFDGKTIKNLKRIQERDFQLDEDAHNGKIVVKPVDLISL